MRQCTGFFRQAEQPVDLRHCVRTHGMRPPPRQRAGNGVAAQERRGRAAVSRRVSSFADEDVILLPPSGDCFSAFSLPSRRNRSQVAQMGKTKNAVVEEEVVIDKKQIKASEAIPAAPPARRTAPLRAARAPRRVRALCQAPLARSRAPERRGTRAVSLNGQPTLAGPVGTARSARFRLFSAPRAWARLGTQLGTHRGGASALSAQGRAP